jgi:hypothetical protein
MTLSPATFTSLLAGAGAGDEGAAVGAGGGGAAVAGVVAVAVATGSGAGAVAAGGGGGGGGAGWLPPAWKDACAAQPASRETVPSDPTSKKVNVFVRIITPKSP